MNPIPRLDSYPVAEKLEGSLLPNMDKLPAHVMHEWIAKAYGEGELQKLDGIPVRALHAIYPDATPEMFVAFTLIRDTPALNQIQLLTDTIYAEVNAAADINKSDYLRQVQNFYQKFDKHQYALDAWLDYEEPELAEELDWLAWQVMQRFGNNIPDGTGSPASVLHGTYCLIGVLAARVVGPANLRAQLQSDDYYFDETFKRLGFPEFAGAFATIDEVVNWNCEQSLLDEEDRYGFDY